MQMDRQMLNQSPLPLLAGRSTKRHNIREVSIQYGPHRISCEREGKDDEAGASTISWMMQS